MNWVMLTKVETWLFGIVPLLVASVMAVGSVYFLYIGKNLKQLVACIICEAALLLALPMLFSMSFYRAYPSFLPHLLIVAAIVPLGLQFVWWKK